jgi:hypothetical protein
MNDSEQTKPAPKNDGPVTLTGHLAQIYGDWMHTHKGSKPPLYRDSTTGELFWLNRKERRARAKHARSRK